jgi:integrase
VLDRGRIVAEGTPEDLKRRIPGAHIRLRFADAASLDAAARALREGTRDDEELALRVPNEGGIRSLRDVLARLGDGSYTQPSKLTLADFLATAWLPAVEPTVRPLTFMQYRSVVRLRILPTLGHRRLQQLTGGHLNTLYRELEQAGLSVSTRRLTHAVLHRALKDAVRWGRLVRNPAAMADPPAGGRSRARAWSARELGRFLEHVRRDRLFALWRLAATTGMRRGELAGLTWRCLDLDGARLSVEQQLIPTRGGVSFARRSRPARGGRSRSTGRRWLGSGSTGKRSSSNATSPGTPTPTRISSSPTSWAGRFIPSA